MDNFVLTKEFIAFKGDYHDYLDAYRQVAAKNQISATGIPCRNQSPSTIEKSKEDLIAPLFSYWGRLMALLHDQAVASSSVFCIFDAEGRVLSYDGNPTLINELNQKGLIHNVQWSLETMGPNAVTVGLKEAKWMHSVGEENFHSSLFPYAIYFHPIILRNQVPLSDLQLRCGLAMITIQEQASVDRAMHLAVMGHDLLMNTQFYMVSNHLYGRVGRACLLIDIRMHAEPIITHTNSHLFELFDLEPEDVAFQRVDSIIDPLPKNAELWDIIHHPRTFSDIEIEISIHGKKKLCSVFGFVHNQPAMNTGGINLFITTLESISGEVAEKIGNNALKSFDTIIGKSPTFLSAVRKGRMFTRTESNIMILGESGVGKDVFAQAIHNDSSRRNKPFIAINCGALPRDLIASELFGYDGGAFTGAKRQGNIGKFELANGGTLFLDEIGELPLDLQATLLRAVETKQIMRIGSNRVIDVDVKIISATNADIPAMIEQKLFRADLYYRLNTMQLMIPPLRERGDDVILLAEYFMQRVACRIGRSEKCILSPEAKRFLTTLPWQGNIRELQNLMERVVQLYSTPVIEVEHIADNIMPQQTGCRTSFPAQRPVPMPRKKDLLTREDILIALEKCSGNRSEAARYLGIARQTLYRNMERLGMDL